jgi:hypothetical protein
MIGESAKIQINWKERGSRKYSVVFKDGSISNGGGIKNAHLNMIKTRLETISPLRCDVWEKVAIDK